MNPRTRLAAVAALTALGAAPQASAASAAPAASVTISPLPGTPTALPQTQISFLGAAASALGSISVVGSRSGRHGGRLHAYASATGASFVPSRPFTAGEQVTVHASWASSPHSSSTLSDEFTIAEPREVSKSEPPTVPGTPADAQSFQSRPELHPPTVTVHQPASAGVAPGYVLAAPFLGPGQYGPMIFDNAGELVWFKPLAGGEDAADLRTQVFHGKNDLTWWQGHTLQLGYGLGEDVIVDANYKTVAVVRAGNGLQADEHEFSLTPQGAAFVVAYSPVQTSLASAGGPASGIALDCVIQEIDVHTGLVMAEWHSLGDVTAPEPCPSNPNDEAPFVQALPGGGSMTSGAGSTTGDGATSFSESDAHGQVVFAAQLPAGERSVRVYREPWSAQPLEQPAIAARTSGGATAVYASWNGATTVDSWQLLTGSTPAHMTAVSTTPKSDFETTIPAPSAPYVEVRALSASGKVLAASNAIQPVSG